MKNTAFKTLKTYSGLNTEITDGGFALPDQILMMLEEVSASKSEKPERFKLDKSMQAALLDRAAKIIMQRNFGKWLPKGADKVMKEAFDGLKTVEDKIASLMWASERLRGLEQWKVEQGVIRRAQRHGAKTNTRKNGGKWHSAEVYELPPLIKSEGNGMQHEPARYAIRLPDGTYCDLGKHDGAWSPVLRSAPDAAMQSIAKRLGKDIRGGAHSILQELTGLTDIIPAYTTIWFQDCWLVIVSWQKDPKLTPSRYWLDENGALTMKQVAEEPPLSVSELDYYILKDCSDLEIHDEEEIIVDYEDPAEASYNLGVERDKEGYAIDTSKFAEDDAELELVMFLQSKLDLNETSITKEDLTRPQVTELLYGEQAINDKGEMQWYHGLKGATQDTAKFLSILNGTGEAWAFEAYNSALMRIKLFTRMINTLEMILENHTQEAVQVVPRYVFTENAFSQTKVRVIENAHILPDNHIESRVTLTSDNKPEGRHGSVRRLKRGTTGIMVEGRKIVTKAIPKLPERPTTARNASPTLKRVLANMIYDKFEYSSEKRAQREFHRTLDIALA